MKTPLQELIKTFEELRSPIDSKVDVDFAISLIKSMLEKEEEVIMDAYGQGREDADDYVLVNESKYTSRDYYNETFKTEE